MKLSGISLRKIVLIIFLIPGLVLFIWFTFVYIRESKFCSPLYVSIVPADSSCSTEVFGVTAAGRRLLLNKDSTLTEWTRSFGFFSSVEIVSSGSFSLCIRRVHISAGDFSLSVKGSELDNWPATDRTGRRAVITPPDAGEKLSLIRKCMLFLKRNYEALFAALIYLLIPAFIFIYPFIRKRFLPKGTQAAAKFRRPHFLQRLKRNKLLFYLVIAAATGIAGLFAVYAWLLFAWGTSGFMTFLTFAIFLTVTGNLVFSWFSIRMRKKGGRILHISWLLMMLTIVCIELYIRNAGKYDTYNEREGLFYLSGFNTRTLTDPAEPWMLFSRPGTAYIDNKPEFSYEISYNRHGFRDKERNTEKKAGEYRIIALGNSFTEGVGAPADSVWPVFLERRLHEKCNPEAAVFNTGLRGTDPCFEYMLYEKKLSGWSADLVIMCIGPSDIKFIINRGGFDRFLPDGSLRYRKKPAWEWLYALSHTFRYFVREKMGYDELLVKESERKEETGLALEHIRIAVEKMFDITRAGGSRLIVVFFPTSDQVIEGKTVFEPLIEELGKSHPGKVFNMLDYYKQSLSVTPGNVHRYYWKTDGHHNGAGYRIFADGIWHFLEAGGITDSICDKARTP